MKLHRSLALWIALVSAVALTLSAPAAQAAGSILYVTPGGVAGGACDSWAAACDLQYALATQAQVGDELWVKAGTYQPAADGNRAATFQLRSGVALYGGFDGDETSRGQRDFAAHGTVLSGDIGTPGSAGDNVYHVVTGTGTDGTALLDGFTITGGNANGTDMTGFGGGMLNENGHPALANLIFTGNSAISGGGLLNLSSSPALANVTFTGNFADQEGGGMLNADSLPALHSVTFSENSADFGGGMANFGSSPVLENVTFTANTAGFFGGGMYNEGGGPRLSQVTFDGNSAGAGGGIFNYSGNPLLVGVLFIDNTAGTNGGGMFIRASNPQLGNVTFNGNDAVEMGGGIFNDEGSLALANITFFDNSAAYGGGMASYNSSPALVNVTFNANSAATGGAMYSFGYGGPTVRNAIFWENTVSQIQFASVSFSIRDSVVQGGCPAGVTCTHVLATDPHLGQIGDYGGNTPTIPLLPGSSAIDSGDDANCPAADQRGVSRKQGLQCDMGAYESRGFTLVKAGGDGQRAVINTAFPDPLRLSVSSDYGDPVDGGVVTFSAPSSGAGATPVNSTPAILNGSASLDLTANGVTGPFVVFAGTSGAAAQPIFILTNTIPDTSTTLASSANPSPLGEPVTFTATVAVVPPGSGFPSGTVQFKVDGANLGEAVALVDGSASLIADALSAGAHAITAEYGGDEHFSPSSGALYQTVAGPAATTTTITSSANPSLAGSPVTFTVTVNAASGSSVPSGTVDLYETTAPEAFSLARPTALTSKPLAGGVATFTLSSFSPGEHTLLAVYHGDPSFNASTSALFLQTVSPKSYSFYLPCLSGRP